MKITTAAKIENIDTIADPVDAELEARDWSLRTRMQVRMAIDELVTNVASYAYQPGTGDVTVCADFEGEDLVLTFTDSGIPYDPTKTREPDITLPAEERPIGGPQNHGRCDLPQGGREKHPHRAEKEMTHTGFRPADRRSETYVLRRKRI